MVKWSVGYYLNKVYSLIFYISGESHQAISMERFVNVFECERFMHRFVSELGSLISATFVSDPYVIAENPNKPNIMYSLHYLSKDEHLNKVFKWVTDELIEKGVTCPRAIIYCQTIEQCSLLYAVLKSNIALLFSGC